MKLQWSGQEIVPAPKSVVWTFVNDPGEVAQCLPDLIEAKTLDPHTFEALVAVNVGPVRGKFKFKIALEPQPDEANIKMKISGGGFGSVVDLLASAVIADNGNGTTTLDWTGTASMRGPVATIGGRVIDAQAERVIGTTFANVKARVATAGAV